MICIKTNGVLKLKKFNCMWIFYPLSFHSIDVFFLLLDYFSSLSDEIVLSIFSWLPKFVLAKCARVCKKWSRLV